MKNYFVYLFLLALAVAPIARATTGNCKGGAVKGGETLCFSSATQSVNSCLNTQQQICWNSGGTFQSCTSAGGIQCTLDSSSFNWYDCTCTCSWSCSVSMSSGNL